MLPIVAGGCVSAVAHRVGRDMLPIVAGGCVRGAHTGGLGRSAAGLTWNPGDQHDAWSRRCGLWPGAGRRSTRACLRRARSAIPFLRMTMTAITTRPGCPASRRCRGRAWQLPPVADSAVGGRGGPRSGSRRAGCSACRWAASWPAGAGWRCGPAASSDESLPGWLPRDTRDWQAAGYFLPLDISRADLAEAAQAWNPRVPTVPPLQGCDSPGAIRPGAWSTGAADAIRGGGCGYPLAGRSWFKADGLRFRAWRQGAGPAWLDASPADPDRRDAHVHVAGAGCPRLEVRLVLKVLHFTLISDLVRVTMH